MIEVASGPSILVYIPTDPKPKARPVVTARGAFTPAKTRIYERTVGMYAMQARGEWQRVHGAWPMLSYVRTDITFRRAENRGDEDNVIKAIHDGLEGVLFANDGQIVGGLRMRVWTGDVGAWVRVTVVEPEGAPPLRPKRASARAPKPIKGHPWRSGYVPPKGYGGGT